MHVRPRVAPLALFAVACASSGIRRFPDRAIAWDEHDDAHVPRRPRTSRVLRFTQRLEDSIAREVDRGLALEGDVPADDVNAADEVPCSTWFCPRNHLRPLSPEEVAAGPPSPGPPMLPLRVVEGKQAGYARGFVADDARGVRYLCKLDGAGHLALATGAEAVGTRLAHAAGWNVPGAFVVDVDDAELAVDPRATYRAHGYDLRGFSPRDLVSLLDRAARAPDGRIRLVAVAWIPGEILGPFEMIGRREGDPNDRIPHERRRSLRASWVFMAWLGVHDASMVNTLDSWVSERGRRFVRHYLIDFGAGFGSGTRGPRDLPYGGEAAIEVGRTFAALISLGAYQRPWQRERDEYQRLVAAYPSIGYFPAEGWDPTEFRTIRRVPAHLRMTDRDAYWGAKIVASFTDDQIRAAVASGGYDERSARYLVHALRVRRDIIARRYLTPVTAVERAAIDRESICFSDLAIERGAAQARDVAYEWRITDEEGTTVAAGRARGAARACLRVGTRALASGYRVVHVRAIVAGRGAKPARIHVAWRADERRAAIVGLERDE